MYRSLFNLYHRRMATIRARKKVDGTVSYTPQIRIKKHGATVYQENQTFARKQAAVAWARRREAELYEPGAIDRANRKGTTVKEVIDRYLVSSARGSLAHYEQHASDLCRDLPVQLRIRFDSLGEGLQVFGDRGPAFP